MEATPAGVKPGGEDWNNGMLECWERLQELQLVESPGILTRNTRKGTENTEKTNCILATDTTDHYRRKNKFSLFRNTTSKKGKTSSLREQGEERRRPAISSDNRKPDFLMTSRASFPVSFRFAGLQCPQGLMGRGRQRRRPALGGVCSVCGKKSL
jgi:hypothetical protein